MGGWWFGDLIVGCEYVVCGDVVRWLWKIVVDMLIWVDWVGGVWVFMSWFISLLVSVRCFGWWGIMRRWWCFWLRCDLFRFDMMVSRWILRRFGRYGWYSLIVLFLLIVLLNLNWSGLLLVFMIVLVRWFDWLCFLFVILSLWWCFWLLLEMLKLVYCLLEIDLSDVMWWEEWGEWWWYLI